MVRFSDSGSSMAGLSRRQFVTRVGTLAAAWGIAPQVLGHALVARAQPASGETDVGGTLAQTILRSSTGPGRYRVLAAGPEVALAYGLFQPRR